MKYYLVQKYGPTESPQFRRTPFPTEPEAVIHACGLIAAGAANDTFEVDNEKGETVADDENIRSRCKQTRMP